MVFSEQSRQCAPWRRACGSDSVACPGREERWSVSYAQDVRGRRKELCRRIGKQKYGTLRVKVASSESAVC